MKKLLALLLCVVLILPVLAGCTKPGSTTQGSDLYKEPPEGYTFKIGLPTQSLITDYDENAFTKWLEEQTGYDIEIVQYASNPVDYQAQISVDFEVPGQKMPDILWGMKLGDQAIEAYGKKGDVIDLSTYFNDKEVSGSWWTRLDKIEDKEFVDYVVRNMHADDGKAVYVFPTIEYNQGDMMRHQVFINQEWLNKLNLPMPTNTEELYNVLKAFKSNDLTGNGDTTDEIPLVGKAGSDYGDVISWITNMFCYVDDSRTWRVDENGKISGFYWDDKYREALIFLNKLVKEGLMPETVFTMTSPDLQSLVNPIDGVETVGIWLGHPSLALSENSEAVDVYKAMPHWGYTVINMATNFYETMITRDCEYPLGAWKILMAMSSEEGAYRLRYGEKGVDWDYADPGTTSFAGLEAEIKVMNQKVYGGSNAQTWNQVAGTIGLANENERTQFDPAGTDWNTKKLALQGECFKNIWNRYEAQGGRPANVVMPLVYTAEEDDEISVDRTNVNNWYKTNRASFIKGAGELNNPADDAQWQKYIDGFKTQGYDKWLEVAQDVYDFTYGDKSGK